MKNKNTFRTIITIVDSNKQAKKRYIFLLLLVFIPQITFSQEDSLQFRHSITVNINDLFIGRLLVTYSKPLSPERTLEVTCGYKYSDTKTVDAGSILFINNAYWYYNTLTLRFGYKQFKNKTRYSGWDFNFNYKFFNKVRFNSYVDHEGDSYDEDYILNRRNYQFGGIYKFGSITRIKKSIILEQYIGLGLLLSLDHEFVLADFNDRGELVPGVYPREIPKGRFFPTIYVGISIGLIK